jgi:hypothetical protein
MSYRPNTTDDIPQLKALTTETLKQLGPFAVHVKTGLFIKDFPVFNVEKNNFTIDSIVWFEFNGDEITQEILEQFTIDNAKIISRSSPDIKKMANGLILAKYNILFELTTDLGFHYFPLDNHRLPIVISHDFRTPKEMIFSVDASSFQLQPHVIPTGWSLRDLNVNAGYLSIQLDQQDATKKTENPKALFTINFNKNSMRKALIIFIPLFSAAFLSLLSFVVNMANISSIFNLTASALTALLTYRFVIEQLMPSVGYFTLADSIYLFLLFFAFIIFSIQLLISRRYMTLAVGKSNEHKEIPIKQLENIANIIFIIMCFLLVAGTTYILLYT